MDDETQALPPEPDDDLLDWMPPELVERARKYEERDASTKQSKVKKKRVDYTVPPKAKRKRFSLGALAGGALLMAVSTALSATGAYGAQSVQEKGRVWLALWLAGQAFTLCVYLLFLLPMPKKPRRAALILTLGGGLAFGLAASMTNMMPVESESVSLPVQIITLIFALLLALAFSPNLWLMLGALRRKTTEKFSVLMGGINLAIGLLGLITTLAKGNTGMGTLVTALNIGQGLCFLCLVASWPVLDRAVLSKGETDGQPE